MNETTLNPKEQTMKTRPLTDPMNPAPTACPACGGTDLNIERFHNGASLTYCRDCTSHTELGFPANPCKTCGGVCEVRNLARDSGTQPCPRCGGTGAGPATIQ